MDSMRPPQQREAQLAAGQPARQSQTRITASFRSPTSTQRPPKSIRHPATLDNAQNLLKIQGSNEGTAFRGDQTTGLPLKASMKEKHFFFSRRGSGKAAAAPRPLHSGCAGLPQPGHPGPKAVLGPAWSSRRTSTATRASARLWPAKATVRLGLGFCAAVARVNLRRRHFPLAPVRYSRAHTHANVPPEAA